MSPPIADRPSSPGDVPSAEELCGRALARAEAAHSRLDELAALVGRMPDEIKGIAASGMIALLLEVRDATTAIRAELAARKAATLGETLRRWLPVVAVLTPILGALFAAILWVRAHVSLQVKP